MSNWESYVWEKWESSSLSRDNGWICLVVVQFSWAHTLARKFKGVAGYDCRYIANLRMYNVGLFTHCNCVVCSLISIVPKRYYNNISNVLERGNRTRSSQSVSDGEWVIALFTFLYYYYYDPVDMLNIWWRWYRWRRWLLNGESKLAENWWWRGNSKMAVRWK